MQRMILKSAWIAILLAISSAAAAQVPERAPRTSSQPGAVPRRPGTETTIALPAGRFAMSKMPAAVQLIKTDVGWRAREIAVGTTGGYNPVTLTIDAGAQSGLFEFGAPRSGRISGSTTGRDALARPAETATTGPADSLNRILRFNGGSTSLPDAIPVKVTARDGKGAILSATTTFYPVAPSVSAVTGYEGKSAGQTIPVLRITVVGLGAARGFKHHGEISGCRYEQNPTISFGEGYELGGAHTGPTDTHSFYRNARLGMTNCSGLTFKFALKFPSSSEYLEPFTLKTPAFQLSPRQTYTFTNTWDLQAKLGFAVHEATGKCQGRSEMPAQPSYPVGVVRDRGDITFTVRSAPLGTHCVYASKTWVLPDGFQVTSFDLSSSRSGPEEPAPEGSYGRCCTGLGDGKMCSGTTIPHPGLAGFSFTRGLKPMRQGDPPASFQVSGWQTQLVTPDNVILYDSPDNQYTTVIPPLMAKPSCLNTLLNDHFVTIRIDEISFSGPAGVAFP